MLQRTSHHHIIEPNRLAAVAGMVQRRGMLVISLLALVLLITNGGAG